MALSAVLPYISAAGSLLAILLSIRAFKKDSKQDLILAIVADEVFEGKVDERAKWIVRELADETSRRLEEQLTNIARTVTNDALQTYLNRNSLVTKVEHEGVVRRLDDVAKQLEKLDAKVDKKLEAIPTINEIKGAFLEISKK